MVTALPIDASIETVRASLKRFRAVVITAEPGAGKTTRVPPALLDAGPVILLQPRRVAVRSVAARIADEQGWTLGREVGWQVRFERRFSQETRLLVVTEGILTARLQVDPLLSTVHTVVIDEFHERSIHADLALALCKQAWHARDDLRIVVMSATLEAEPIAGFLDGCPVITVPGRDHPLEVSYAPGEAVAPAALRLVSATGGDVLCFLPGAFEIRRTIGEIGALQGGLPVDVLPLHGSLDSTEQQRALSPPPSGRMRIVVATNIAETSLTVPGLRGVVDSGLQKVARYDAGRGIDSLTTERIPQDAADQRAGRAGRTAGGRAVRLWDASDRLRPHREADIHRIDLVGAALDIFGWGGDPRNFEWFERPDPAALDAALTLLLRLDAVRDSRLTPIGLQMQHLSLHPRLSRMLVHTQGAWTMVQACALLSERLYLAPRSHATSADLLSAIDDWESVPAHVKLVATEIERQTSALSGSSGRRLRIDDREFRRALLAGYPDRVAQRREPGSTRVKLASGSGAVMGRESGVVEGEFLAAIDVRGGATESTVRIAARLEADWLEPTARVTRCWFDDEAGLVRAALVECYDAIVLRETPIPPEEELAATLLAEAWLRRGPAPEDTSMLRRMRFAGLDLDDLPSLVRRAARGQVALARVSLQQAIPSDLLRALDRDAPQVLRLPSGRPAKLEYTEDGGVKASVKLQELFGQADTPRVGPRDEAVLLAMLAPNGRPVQLTRDLRSFWTRTYPEIRRELRGRYPRHPWPEDPWHAVPTARTKPRPS